MGPVRGELGGGVDRALGDELGDRGPVVDDPAFGGLDPTGVDDVVVEASGRLHRGDGEQVGRALHGRAVAGLAAVALPELPDATVAEGLRGQPLDEVVGVATVLGPVGVAPGAARASRAPDRAHEGHVAALGEEHRLPVVEIGHERVGGELDDEPGVRTGRRLAVEHRTVQPTAQQGSVTSGHLDQRALDLERRRPLVGPPGDRGRAQRVRPTGLLRAIRRAR